MKIFKVSQSQNVGSLNFQGKRLDRKAVEQLGKNNPYSLTEPNSRYISNSIDNLSKVSGSENLKFLLDTAAKNKYSTNIKLPIIPKTNWKTKLLAAAAAVIAITPFVDEKLISKFKNISKTSHKTQEEKDIINLREQLLNAVDMEQINKEALPVEQAFQKNLDSFIMSSETTISHKKYVLERLNYLMSDDYKINTQLSDKKSLVAAEIVNDIAINTGGDIPNIKAVNQRAHGMCAAISIVRKKLVYEDKPNYIDSILSELDNTSQISVYDRNALGTKKKIKVRKVPVDFDAALAKGYRIIDASTMHWMAIATMSGEMTTSYSEYNPFDKNNFDVKTDSFFDVKFADADLEKTQEYYQALTKAKNVINSYKSSSIIKTLTNDNVHKNKLKNAQYASKLYEQISALISKIIPNANASDVRNLINGILKLEVPYSSKIKENDKFSYIPNEEDIMKKEKIASYIKSKTGVDINSSKDLEELLDLITEHHEYAQINTTSEKTSATERAFDLYEVESAFRYQFLAGLEDPLNYTNILKENKFPDRETFLLQTLDKIQKGIDQGGENKAAIIKHFKDKYFDKDNMPDDEDVVKIIGEARKNIETYLTAGLDSIYKSLLMGSRKDGLIRSLSSVVKSVDEGNEESINSVSSLLKINNTKEDVMKELTNDIKNLSKGDEQEYLRIFKKYDNWSQLEAVNSIYKEFLDMLKTDDTGTVLLEFMAANNIEVDDDPEKFQDKLKDIKYQIDTMTAFIEGLIKSLRIEKNNGEMYISASQKDNLIKLYENQGIIIPAKDLKQLQQHLDKLRKVRSTDEFKKDNSGKLPKELTTFSKSEEETLKTIERSINIKRAEVQKQLRAVQKVLQEPLEELKREVGVHDGTYYVPEEGSSGLTSEKEIRIMEYMTGRPHYVTTDLKTAFEKIKTSPYSGTATSSPSHDHAGLHAQYIEDIAPVKVKVKDESGNEKEEEREVLFQDNTWGALEQKNTWVDSYGLTRTDYKSGRGGTLGYITDAKYRNGNFVNRILNEMVVKLTSHKIPSKRYNKLNSDYGEYAHPQYLNVILDGKSPESEELALQLYETMFPKYYKYTNKIGKLAQTKTLEELKQAISDTEVNYGNAWRVTYDELKNRIFPNAMGKQISTKEDYDTLKDDDYLKISLEKLAVNHRFVPMANQMEKMSNIDNLADLENFKKQQNAYAKELFYYKFGKSPSVVKFLQSEFKANKKDIIETFASYNEHLTSKTFNKIAKSFIIDKSKYDGSLKNAAQEVYSNVLKTVDEVIQNEKAKNEFKVYIKSFIYQNLYFNKSDISNTSLDKFIERLYDPSSDEEFVKAYRRIQNMTTKEFEERIMPNVTLEDMDVKQVTGFDVLKKIQMYNKNLLQELKMSVFNDKCYKEAALDSRNVYLYDKLSKNVGYAIKQDFAYMYNKLLSSLYTLTYKQQFDSVKDLSIKKYNQYPAYPKVNFINNDVLKKPYDSLISLMENNIQSIKGIKQQILTYEYAHSLAKLAKRVDENGGLTPRNKIKLQQIIQKMYEVNSDNDAGNVLLDTLAAAMILSDSATWEEYSPIVECILDQVAEIEDLSSKEGLNDTIDNLRATTRTNMQQYATIYVQTKYQNTVIELMNKLENSMKNNNKELTESLKRELYNSLEKYHILRNPKDLLDNYIKFNAKDSIDKNDLKLNEIYKNLMIRALNYARLVAVQDLIMEATRSGASLSVKDELDEYVIKLKEQGFVNLKDPKSIALMTNSLIVDENTEIASLFLNKFGLSEIYVKEIIDSTNIEELKRNADAVAKEVDNFKKFQEALVPYFEKISQSFDNEDGEEFVHLKKLNSIIKKKAKEYSIDRNVAKIYQSAIDSTIDAIQQHQENSRKDVLYTVAMSKAQSAVMNICQQSFNKEAEIVKSIVQIVELVGDIPLTKDTKLSTERELFIEKIQEFLNDRQKLLDLQDE